MHQLVVLTLHKTHQRTPKAAKRHGRFHPRLMEEEDTPHSSPSQMGGLLSTVTAPPLTTGAELETAPGDKQGQELKTSLFTCWNEVRTESPPSHTPAHNTLTCVQPPLHGFTQFSHLWVAPHCHNYVTDFNQGLFGARSLQTIV